MRVVEKAYAKVNLILDITGRRANGYHDIRTVMQTVDLCDILEFDIAESNEFNISLSCKNAEKFPDITWDDKNLMAKAAKLICEQYNKKVNIHISIQKNIPSGAGMAGGSADAACVLTTLNTCLQLGLSCTDLCLLGVQLGADVPFCIVGGTVLCEGIGEVLTPLNSLAGLTLVCVKPTVSISTKYIYEQIDAPLYNYPHPDVDSFIKAVNNGQSIENHLGNYLEGAAISYAPVVKDMAKALLNAGCSASLMTGSGSVVFGICNDIEKAKEILDLIPGSFLVTTI